MVELEDLVFTPGLLPFWRKSIFHNGPGSLRLLWPQSQWHFGRQLHVWSDPLLERGLGPNRGLHRRPARHSNGTALAWDVFGHQHQRCENWARHEEKKLAGDESVMCHRGQWWGLLGHTFLFCIAANHWCLAHLRMFGPGNPTDGLNLNQHYNSIAYAKSGEVLIASSQNSPYVSLYVPWSKGSRWKHRGVKTP